MNNNQFYNYNQYTNNAQNMNNKKPSKNNKNILLIVYIIGAISLVFGGYKLGLFDSFTSDSYDGVESSTEIEKPKVTPTPTATTVVNSMSISITNTNPTVSIGNSIKLNTKILPENTTDKTVIWTSSNEEIAVVDSNGNVTGIALGNATVNAKNGEVTTSIQVTVSPIEVTSIKLNKTSTTIVVDGSETIIATINPAGAVNKAIEWKSSDESIVTVNNGTIVGKKVGKATITVTCGDKTANVTVTVNKKPSNTVAVKSVALNKSNATLSVGNSITIVATVSPDNATNKSITWTSSDDNIASVNNGIITAKTVGTTTITAKSGKESATIKITVNPIKVKSISLNKKSTSIVLGNQETITVIFNPANTTDKTVTWSSSDKTIATVSNGVITAKKVGTAKITAKSGGKTASVNVTVKPVTVQSISLNKTSSTMFVGNNETLTATVNPSNASNKKVIWTSSDSTVATVNSSGTVTAKKAGTTTITAKSEDGNKIATCLITVYSDSMDRIKVYFLNTQDSPSMVNAGVTYDSNESIIVQTKDNKYILFDTGNEDTNIYGLIYQKLKQLQNNSKIVIDYLIISHLDKDHIGNAVRIINSNNIQVNNLIIKEEKTFMNNDSSAKKRYNDVVNAANSKGVNVIKKLSEGQTIKLGSYVEMTFFNTSDVFAGMACKEGQTIRFTAKIDTNSINYFKTGDNKYVYYDNTDGKYPKKELKTTKKLVQADNANGLNKYFYAYYFNGNRGGCSSNGNSYAMMISVSVENNETKYIYMPGDLENIGYDIFPTKVDGYNSKIYSNGGSYFLENITFDESSGKFTSDKNNLKVPAETNTAIAISNHSKFKGKLKNIVIYQESHHGFNNAKDAIDILGLNRSDLYAVATASGTFKKSSSLIRLVSYYYSLGKVREDHKFTTGKASSNDVKNGVYCNIKYDASVKCENY